MRLIVEEIGDFLMEVDEAVTAIERRDIIGGVGRGGRGHGLQFGLASAVKAEC